MNCQTHRRGVGRLDALFAIAAICGLGAVALPAMLYSRESARHHACLDNLARLGTAIHSYHSVAMTLPPLAFWSAGDLNVELIHGARYTGHVTHANWALLLTPHLHCHELSASLDSSQPITSPVHAALRMETPPIFRCPSDPYNHKDNPYLYQAPQIPQASFGRGNYAINGGTHNDLMNPGTPLAPSPDGLNYRFDAATRQFQWWGNGIAGINKTFRLSDIRNQLATTVALDELRAGIDAADPRGVWAFGQIGGSATWSHGVLSDAGGPNNQGSRSDDILGCDKLHELLGADTLAAEEMPCCSYCPRNAQATARSMHSGGVNSLMLDGSAHFISNKVDPSLWHVLHSREYAEPIELEPNRSPSHNSVDIPAASVSRSAELEAYTRDLGSPSTSPVNSGPAPRVLKNSIGMELALVPPGNFVMGLPDDDHGRECPAETPAHRVQITRTFFLGIFEVTQAEYDTVLGENPSWHTKDKVGRPTDRYAVENVTWHDAARFCEKLSNRAEEKKAGRVYRLPTDFPSHAMSHADARCRRGECHSGGTLNGAGERSNAGRGSRRVGAVPPTTARREETGLAVAVSRGRNRCRVFPPPII